jgi:hypothetical protein
MKKEKYNMKKKSKKIKCSDISLKHVNLGVKLTTIGPVTHPELFHEVLFRLSTLV